MFKTTTGALILLLTTILLTSCSDDGTTEPGIEDPTYATLSFLFDDSTEAGYTAADGLAWKGTFGYDADTGLMTYDADSGGPFVMLHDDGPLDAGGHEPAGATAGDHVWGATARLATPEQTLTLEYGVIHGSTDGGDGDWVPGTVMRSVVITTEAQGALDMPGVPLYFTPHPRSALIEFAIDDRANAVETTASGLAWKGSFSFDAATRTLTYDGSWQGPYVPVWDDGAWNEGGHEATGATAGDHIWSVAVWMANDDARTLEYGAIRNSVNGSDGNWIWIGSNGTVTIPLGADGPITAPGLILE